MCKTCNIGSSTCQLGPVGRAPGGDTARQAASFNNIGVGPINSPNSGRSQPFRSISCATSVLSARARPGQKKQFGAEMDDGGWCADMPRQRMTGIHRLSFGSITIRQCARSTLPARRRTSHGSLSAALQLLLVQQPLWEPRTGTSRRHRGPARVTRNMRRVGAYGRAGWLVIGSKLERVGAPRQQVETQKYRSSGRQDVSGCLRPCLLAYYDLCFLGMDSRVANWVICKVGDCPYPLYPG